MDSKPVPLKFTEYEEQKQSPLFSFLPSEIRHEIFAYALTSAPETAGPTASQNTERNEYCVRPGYETRHRIWTELLRSCKRIYMEASLMPFTCSEHAFYMAWEERAPPHRMSLKQLQECLDQIYHRQGELRGGHIRLFAQACFLDPSLDLMGLLTTRHFYPKTFTVTIRYTDTWRWEDNKPLHIPGKWCKCMVLPASVSSFTMEIESLERRKDEVDYIAMEAAKNWHFKRTDDVNLLANPQDISVFRWTGSSVLGGRRWVRDEARPGQLDYYIASVTWRPSQNPVGDRPETNPDLTVKWKRQMPRSLGYDFINDAELRELGIPLDTPAEKAVAQYAAETVQERSLVVV